MFPRWRALARSRVYGRTVRKLSIAVVLAALLASSGVVLAAGPTIKVDPTTVQRGYVVRVFGVVPGCAIGNQVTLLSRAFSHRHEFAGVPAIRTEVGTNHKYSKRTRIPAGRRPGLYAITGRCGGGNLGVTAHLRVTRAYYY
jgi:hypothetical protein